jgi:hypothetical protein
MPQQLRNPVLKKKQKNKITYKIPENNDFKPLIYERKQPVLLHVCASVRAK